MEKDLWIYAHWNTYTKELEYNLRGYEMSESSGDVLLEKRTINFDTPNDKELRSLLGLAMRQRLNLLKGEHHKEELELSEIINELLSLEFKPASDDIPF